MKQRGKPLFVYPRKEPKTILGIYKWHRRLLEGCLCKEFEQRALRAGIEQIKKDIAKHLSRIGDGVEGGAARLALAHLNELKNEWQERLRMVKEVIRVFHDTNEKIISSLLAAHGSEALVREVGKLTQPGANLLHEPGWLFELAVAEDFRQRGYVAFVTFGTEYDSRGVDVVALPQPMRRVKWKERYPASKATRLARRRQGTNT